MTKFEQASAFSRRSVLLGGGALGVACGAAVSLDTVWWLQRALGEGAKPPLTPDQLSSYIAVNADGSVAAYFGKMDMGHGLHVAIAQIVAEELDVPFKRVRVFMADTATSVNQGGASGSTGIQNGGKQMRRAAGIWPWEAEGGWITGLAGSTWVREKGLGGVAAEKEGD